MYSIAITKGVSRCYQNKRQVICLICQFIFDHKDEMTSEYKLVITGTDPIPIEMTAGNIRERTDIQTTHEEADVIVPRRVVYLAESGKNNVTVLADDTDIFVLLLHAYIEKKLSCSLMMAGTNMSRSAANITATAEKHAPILADLLAAHIISGCDTMSYLWGIGKATVRKVLKSGTPLKNLGCAQIIMVDILGGYSFYRCLLRFPTRTRHEISQVQSVVLQNGKSKIEHGTKSASSPTYISSFC